MNKYIINKLIDLNKSVHILIFKSHKKQTKEKRATINTVRSRLNTVATEYTLHLYIY